MKPGYLVVPLWFALFLIPFIGCCAWFSTYVLAHTWAAAFYAIAYLPAFYVGAFAIPNWIETRFSLPMEGEQDA